MGNVISKDSVEQIKQFWDGSEIFLEKIEGILSDEITSLKTIHSYSWNPKDPGVAKRPSGLFIPKIFIEHRLLYLGYDLELIISYLNLFKEIKRERGHPIAEFAIRTLYELAFPKTQLLLDKKLSQSDRDKYRLIIVLADYSYISYDNRELFRDFKKLINDEKKTLEAEPIIFRGDKISLYDFYQKVITSINDKQQTKHLSLCKDARRFITDLQAKIFKNKSEILNIFNGKNLDALSWSYSHLLHGSTILMRTLFIPPVVKNRVKLKATWALMLTGINIVHFFSLRLGEGNILKRVKEAKSDFEKLTEFISKNHSLIEVI